jgi:hypothetical protein
MKIDEENVWFSLVSFIAQKMQFFSVRDLSTIARSLALAQKGKPILLNFDDLFIKMELHFVKKFE